MLTRCSWATKSLLLQQYHDAEWGVMVATDDMLFRQLCLQILQTGLQWELILKYRSDLDHVLKDFDAALLANMNAQDKQAYLTNPHVIQNERKLDAMIHNAQVWTAMTKHGISPRSILQELKDQLDLTNPEQVCTFVEQTHQFFKTNEFMWIGSDVTRNLLMATGFISGHEPECWRFSQN